MRQMSGESQSASVSILLLLDFGNDPSFDEFGFPSPKLVRHPERVLKFLQDQFLRQVSCSLLAFQQIAFQPLLEINRDLFHRKPKLWLAASCISRATGGRELFAKLCRL